MPPANSLESLMQSGGKTAQVEKKLLLKKISEMNNLPTPSANMMKVMLLLRDEDVKIDSLVVAIEKDQSMVAQILKLVNSGFYGLRKTVESVEHAIALLGIINIKQVVYSASIMEFFTDDEQLEWNHSYSSSVMMGTFIKENELPGINILPLSMLMHDLGKVVLRRFSPKKYQVVLQHAATDKLPTFRVEDAMLQINHAEVGGILLEKWDSAEELVKPVFQHHMDVIPESFVFETALVQFINWIDCTARGIPCYEPSRDLLNAAGIEEIDKNYWLNKQAELIASLESKGGVQMKPASGSSGAAPKSDTDTKSLEKRASSKAASSSSKEAAPLPASTVDASQAAEDNDTASLITLPKEGDHDTATINVPERAPSQPSQPQIVTRVNNPLLSGKEIALMKKTYRQQAADPSAASEEAPKESVPVERPPSAPAIESMQVLRRKPAPVSVNVNPLPPQADEEVAASQSEPSVPGVQRPTQVLNRKTGAPVAPAPEPELKGSVIEEPRQEPPPQPLRPPPSPREPAAPAAQRLAAPGASLKPKGFLSRLLGFFSKK